MDAVGVLSNAAATADGLFTRVLAPVTAEQANWRPEGGTNNPIAAIAVHAYFSEDRMVQARLLGRPTVAESGGWAQRLGMTPSAIWTPLSNPEPDLVRGYAAAVRAATVEFLESLDPARLDEEVDTPVGRGSAASALNLILVVHKSAHLGEIAALIGAQGGKGLPF